MSISRAGAPEPGTSATESEEAPETGTSLSADEIARLQADAQSYNELRPRWTQDTQRLSEYEQLFEALQDPETQAEALAALGLELETGAQPGEGEDANLENWDDPLEKEIAELKGTVNELRSQRELEAEQQEEEELIELRDEYIGQAITQIESGLKEQNPAFKGFAPEDERVLGNLAIAMEREDGVPDVEAAYNELYGKDSVVERSFAQRVAHRQGAPRVPQGLPAPSQKKPTTGRERAQLFDERLSAMEADGDY